ncbi:MAG TPA: ABC transporter permease [Ignavibacteria bacterium]|nr:ABC transporter permease [Ignavibacteria bacterium]
MEILTTIFSFVFLSQVLRIFTPYFLGATGANFSERGGVINIAIEGFMISGAFCFTVITVISGYSFLGISFALLINSLLAVVFSVFVLKLRLNQILIGVGLNLLIAGLAKFFMMYIFKSSSNTPRIDEIPRIPFLESIPYFGNILSDYIILFSLILISVSQFVLYKTKFGLRLRSCGENPEAAETSGVNVHSYKFYGILISALLSCLAGIWLASNQNSYSDGMVAGRGYIAIAAMIIGKWKPVNIFWACILFSFFEALEISLQIIPTGIPNQLIQMLPYLITLLVLIGFIGKTKPPAADGVPY